MWALCERLVFGQCGRRLARPRSCTSLTQRHERGLRTVPGLVQRTPFQAAEDCWSLRNSCVFVCVFVCLGWACSCAPQHRVSLIRNTSMAFGNAT